MSCESPWLVGRSEGAGHERKARGGPGGSSSPRSGAEGMSCESPWLVGRSEGAGHERKARGGPGGSSSPRSGAEGMSCESPWLVGRSERAGHERKARGGPGGSSSPRSGAEGMSCESPWLVGRSEGAGHERKATRGKLGGDAEAPRDAGRPVVDPARLVRVAHPDVRRHLAAHGDEARRVCAALEGEGAVERRRLDHGEDGAGADADLVEVGEQFLGDLRDLGDRSLLARPEGLEGPQFPAVDGADGVAVGAVLGIAEGGGQVLLHPARDSSLLPTASASRWRTGATRRGSGQGPWPYSAGRPPRGA